MKKPAAAIGIAAAAILLGISLTGCRSDSDTKTTTSTSTSTSVSTTTTTSAQASAAQTIDEYLQQNNIQRTDVSRDTPGAPAIDLPVPDGWTQVDPEEGASYGGITFSTPTDANDPPRIAANVSKLSGNVDPEKLLAVAGGELKGLEGFEGGDGTRTTMDGQKAFQITGTYTNVGAKRIAAQKTVVIEGGDGIYLFQLNGKAPEVDNAVLAAAMDQIDLETKITA